MKICAQTYERLLPRVEKPGRYLGNERGASARTRTRSRLRFALAFPEVYEIAQSHLGLQILYDILNRRAGRRRRARLRPVARPRSAAARARACPLVSLESTRRSPTSTSSASACSTSSPTRTCSPCSSWAASRCAPRDAARRSARHRRRAVRLQPRAAAPLPRRRAPRRRRGGGRRRSATSSRAGTGATARALLARAGRRPRRLRAGVLRAALRRRRHARRGRSARRRRARVVAKRVLPDLDRFRRRRHPVVPERRRRARPRERRGDARLREGLPLLPGRLRLPAAARAQPASAWWRSTSALMARTGYEEVSLLSLSHRRLQRRQPGAEGADGPARRPSASRSRCRRRASTRSSPRILEQIRRVRKTGFTLAPEAGTQRLRDVIQKEYREEELLDAARRLRDLGWRTLKLYFMIGLPSETEEDVRGIAELAGARRRRRRAAGSQVTASVSTFSPKPHTPFQWAAQLDRRGDARRASRCSAASSAGAASSSAGTTRGSPASRASSRAATAASPTSLETAHRLGAASTAGPITAASTSGSRRSPRTASTPRVYLRRRPLDETLPWDHLDARRQQALPAAGPRARRRGASSRPTARSSAAPTAAPATSSGAQRRLPPRGRQGRRAPRRGRSRAGRSSRSPRGDDAPGSWETRGWREIREARARQRRRRRAAAVAPRRAVDAAPLPGDPIAAAPTARAAPRAATATPRSGSAPVPSSLAPARRTAPAGAARPPPLPQARPARFIGTRELTTSSSAPRGAPRLPLAFSQGHHPLPRLSLRPRPAGRRRERRRVPRRRPDRGAAAGRGRRSASAPSCPRAAACSAAEPCRCARPASSTTSPASATGSTSRAARRGDRRRVGRRRASPRFERRADVPGAQAPARASSDDRRAPAGDARSRASRPTRVELDLRFDRGRLAQADRAARRPPRPRPRPGRGLPLHKTHAFYRRRGGRAGGARPSAAAGA